MYRNRNYRYTEEILNGTQWITASGKVLEPQTMEEEHIRNILRYLYIRRDVLWLRCKDYRVIENYASGEDFFQKVIRKSTIWNSLINALEKPNVKFNFNVEGGSYW